MIRKSLGVIISLILITASLNAKIFQLQSVDQAKPFSLRIYSTVEGKGAFVQYAGQQKIILLQLKRFTVSVLNNSNKQPEGYYYEWDELLNGKVTGRYVILEHSGKVTESSYVRNRDGRKFILETSNRDASAESTQKYLLHSVLITYSSASTASQFRFTYPDGKSITPSFTTLDGAPDVTRTCYIQDYNFDGYDDLAFSVPDAGMGVYQTFNIWVYNPETKRFQVLEKSNDSRAKCSCLCDVTLNPKKKLLSTTCRGGARWWRDIYRLGKDNRLIWLRFEEGK